MCAQCVNARLVLSIITVLAALMLDRYGWVGTYALPLLIACSAFLAMLKKHRTLDVMMPIGVMFGLMAAAALRRHLGLGALSLVLSGFLCFLLFQEERKWDPAQSRAHVMHFATLWLQAAFIALTLFARK
ncbi:MAG: hypothetical protein HY566_03280 [Candidatus Kerfeldbacteria bacterium]|nr:hypothetical protein [Candidatus Kerfeldbacteria bacterium]